jgi:hypothetical protein
MATNSAVFIQNLGPEFQLGTSIANKVTINVTSPGSMLKRDAAGAIAVDTAALAGSTTNTLALAGALLTSTVNGIAATQNLTAAVKAAETLTSLSYVAATGVISYKDELGATTTIDLPMESVFQSVAFDAATNKLTFTLVGGSTSEVDLADLVDAYTLNAGDGLTVTGNGSTATPWVASAKLDPLAGNLLTVSAAGLLVDPSNFPATTNTLVSAANTLTSTVDGVVATAPIVNTNVLAAGTAAGSIKSTVNGVGSNDLDLGAVVRPLANVEVQDAFGVPQYYAFSTNV